MWKELSAGVLKGETKALARAVSLVENEQEGYLSFLQQLPVTATSIIGITGPPGAGKSTLVDALLGKFVEAGKKIAVLCIDPSSPFHFGALLGDRIRMSQWYNSPNVFIRSLANRGNLGGLHPMIIEITDLLKSAAFDYIIIETVGIGQSEVEIAGLADATVVVLVPEAGDEIQTMKAGLMEIADIFVVNKSDRPDADRFVRNLQLLSAPASGRQQHAVPVVKTVAQEGHGIPELMDAIDRRLADDCHHEKKNWLLTEKAFRIIQSARMKDVSKQLLREKIEIQSRHAGFNLYRFIAAEYGSLT